MVCWRFALGFGSRGELFGRLERGWAEALYAAGVALRGRTEATKVRWPLRIGLVGRRLARVPVKRLASSRSMQRENPRHLRGHQERMPSTARNHRDTTLSDRVVGPLDVHQDLPLKHDESLVLVRVGVKRRRLASGHPVLDQRERLVGLLGGRLHGPQTSAGKPAALALSLPSDDRPCSTHPFLLLSCT